MLAGKRIVITGVMTNRSIAFTIARRAQELGAEIVLTSFGRVRRLTERSARQLPDPPPVLELDVTCPEHFKTLRADLEERWGTVHGAVHSVASAPLDAVGGEFMATPAASACQAFEASAFSMKALAESLMPLLPQGEVGGSIVGLDFDSTIAWPRYDWMGVAKAALESVNRYLARYVGPHGHRSNLVAAGLLDTAATAAFGHGWEIWIGEFEGRAPLGWNPSDPVPVADAVCFLLSDLARGVTGEILHVDGGFHAMGGQVEREGIYENAAEALR